MQRATGGKNKCEMMISLLRFRFAFGGNLKIDSIVVCASSPVISKEKDFEKKLLYFHVYIWRIVEDDV